MTWPHEDVRALNEFYGDPRGSNGEASPLWQSANLAPWTPPYPIFYSDGKRSPLVHLRVHRKCLATFTDAFKDALETLGHDYLVEHRLDISGGTFNFRMERGGTRLSVHSWGCAIDVNPGQNPVPHKWMANRGMMDLQFAEILEKHGFCWRGAHGDIDCMHFSSPITNSAH